MGLSLNLWAVETSSCKTGAWLLVQPSRAVWASSVAGPHCAEQGWERKAQECPAGPETLICEEEITFTDSTSLLFSVKSEPVTFQLAVFPSLLTGAAADICAPGFGGEGFSTLLTRSIVVVPVILLMLTFEHTTEWKGHQLANCKTAF
ncbi:Hypothetical predicted protein [Marmota monax]|uniref:Uncharacterized protein n=1 Tax=Marmota monax TaxID=9995 RepID=A0A5E4C457_MARMO|nr:Hypothetical predicted protein [Marmota monax]